MRRLLATGAAVLVASVGCLVPTGSPVQASPGTPGVPSSGVPLFADDFHNTAGAAAVGIEAYVGPQGVRYTADAMWTPTGQACDGWVTKPGAPAPADAGCTDSIWSRTPALATALGRAQAMADPTVNRALTSYTNRTGGNDGYRGTLLKTRSGVAATGGHYYLASVYVGEASCELQPGGDSDLTFSLIKNGVDVVLRSGVKPCAVGTVDRGPDTRHAAPPATPTAAQRTAMQDDVWTTRLVSDPQQLATVPAGGRADLGLRLDDATDTGTGNDLAVDLPRVVDVTPQLDKSFSPATIVKGETAMLTYTITNTDELAAKGGWNFTDVLPAGLTAVGPPTSGSLGPACVGFTGSVTSGRVVVTGSLATGQAACTVNLEVTAAKGGYYTNGPANFPASTTGPACAGGPGVGLCGLNPPADATLTVTPILVDDTATTPYLTPVTVPVLGNDLALPAGSTVTGLQPGDPSQGTWTLNSDGTVTFRPAPGFDSDATATYTVTYPDSTTATARVTVTVLVPPPPITSASAVTGITGTGQPGDDVTVTLPDGSTATSPVGADGTWSVPASRLTPAQQDSLTPNSSVTAVQTDPSTHHGSTLTSMPLPPSVVTDGRSASGRGIPGAVVTVTGGATRCTATVATDETWSCSFGRPLDPSTSVSARQTHNGRTTPESLVSTTTVGTPDPPGPGPQSGPGAGSTPAPAASASPVAKKNAPAGKGTHALASTGADLGLPAALGVAALLVGTGLVVVARTSGRRRDGGQNQA